MGWRPGTGSEPKEPHWDRHGIPSLGPCIRCNLQLEGSGVGADDVVVDGGRVASGMLVARAATAPRRASPRFRRRCFAGGPVGTGGGHGTTLPDDKAYALFENYCKRDFARGFRLCKPYTRAAAVGDR